MLKALKLFIFISVTLFFSSCLDDSPEGCIRCTQTAPNVADCVIDVCDDGSVDTGTATLCVPVTFDENGTQEEIVDELEGQGFSCF